jgi:hypothetical protein
MSLSTSAGGFGSCLSSNTPVTVSTTNAKLNFADAPNQYAVPEAFVELLWAISTLAVTVLGCSATVSGTSNIEATLIKFYIVSGSRHQV